MAFLSVGSVARTAAGQEEQRVEPITTAALDAFLRGYAAEQAMAPQTRAAREKGRRMDNELTERANRWQTCSGQVTSSPEYQKIQTQMEKLGLDNEKETERLAAIRDAMVPKKCGTDPQGEGGTSEGQAMIERAEAASAEAGARAAAMPVVRYALLRERVIGYLLQVMKPDNEDYKAYRFSTAERAALDARRAALMKALRREIEEEF